MGIKKGGILGVFFTMAAFGLSTVITLWRMMVAATYFSDVIPAQLRTLSFRLYLRFDETAQYHVI